jgi:outer membrane protein OmpA-like peptidoglycan-associated protein
MKKLLQYLLISSLLLSACARKKTNVHQAAQKTHAYEKDFDKSATYDENVGAFVLDEDTNHDIFAEATDTGKENITEKAKKQASELDDAWAWQELDEEQPTEVIHFDYDSAAIRHDQEEIVRRDAQLAKLACQDGATVVIEGHSCLITRSQIYNQALSQKRADTVKKQLIKLGVPKNCIKSVGRGTSCVLTHDEGKAAQAANRRAEVKFIYPREEKTGKQHAKLVPHKKKHASAQKSYS